MKLLSKASKVIGAAGAGGGIYGLLLYDFSFLASSAAVACGLFFIAIGFMLERKCK